MCKLHLGCGDRNFGKEWVHIDARHFPHISSHNVKELPYSDESVDIIYTSHMLCYFDRIEVMEILLEWKRVLKPNGILRISITDFEVMAKLYVEDGIPLARIIGPLYGRMEMNGTLIYEKEIYDLKSLKNTLELAGFRDIKRYDWRKTSHAMFDDCSQAYIPHMDKENGAMISLNIECIK
jgi:predicted SAM-dependent methyltransferase